MSNQKPVVIKKHGCYSASNKDLKIRDQQGRLMKGEHDVFVTSNVAKNGFVIVKTITSLENNKTGGFHNTALADVKKGLIIPIPDKEINSKKLSGIVKKGIKIHKSKLYKQNHNFKYPKKYESLID